MAVEPAVESTALSLTTVAPVLILALALPLIIVAPTKYERTRPK